jgi:hypothetical protein
MHPDISRGDKELRSRGERESPVLQSVWQDVSGKRLKRKRPSTNVSGLFLRAKILGREAV